MFPVRKMFPQRSSRSLLRVVTIILLLAGSYTTAGAHDLFLKFTSYFLQPNTQVSVSLLNGTFTQSENAVARDRMTDVTVVGKGNNE